MAAATPLRSAAPAGKENAAPARGGAGAAPAGAQCAATPARAGGAPAPAQCPGSKAHAAPRTWDGDLERYLMSRAVEEGPDGDGDADESAAAAERATLAASLMSDAARPRAWLAFLEHEEGTGGRPSELLRLYGWAVKTVPRSGMSKNADYLRLWVGYALQQMVESEEDARDTFRCLKAQHVGEEFALLYVAWALLESFAGNTGKAEGILRKGSDRGAAPAEAIEEARAQLQSGGAIDPSVLARATVEGPPDAPTPAKVAATPSRVAAVASAPLPEPQPSPMLIDGDDTITIRPASGRRSSRARRAPDPAAAPARFTPNDNDDTVFVKPRAARGATAARPPAAPAPAPAAVPATATATAPAPVPEAADAEDDTVMIRTNRVGGRRQAATAAALPPLAPSPAARTATAMVTPSRPAASLSTPAPTSSTKKAGSLRRLGGLGGPARRVRPGEELPAPAPVPSVGATPSPIAEDPDEEMAAAMKRKMTPGKSAGLGKAKKKVHTNNDGKDGKTPVLAIASRAVSAMNTYVDAVGELHGAVETNRKEHAAAAAATAQAQGAAKQRAEEKLAQHRSQQAAAQAQKAEPLQRAQQQQAQQQQRQQKQQGQEQQKQQPGGKRSPSPEDVRVNPKARSGAKADKAVSGAVKLPFHEDDNSVVVAGVKYAKLECVGKGGSSKVYKVMAPNRKIYAMKRIKLSGRDAESAAGFLDEITLLKRLRGKSNIIQLIAHDVIKRHGLIFVVLEYGEIDLARLLSRRDRERNGAVDENFLRLYWQQMLEAVQTIHEARIVHSDLKPANFLFVEGTLKLIDFGIAKRINDNTTSIVREGQVGTLNYMSPEAILSGNAGPGGAPIKVGRASDVWSLGCILYQMAYRRTPFSHLAFIQKLHAITDPKHAIAFPELPNAQLMHTIRRCLDRDPRTRITMDELLADSFLNPASAAPTPAAAQPTPAPGTTNMSMEQLQAILAQVALAAPGAAVDGAALGKEIFKQLEEGGAVDMDKAIGVVRGSAPAPAAAAAAAHPPPAAAAPPPP